MINIINQINNIIYDWDPINLKESGVPSDEYFIEAKMIYEVLDSNISIDVLSSRIHSIFIDQFGEDLIKFNYDDCRNIANKIIQTINCS